MQKVVVIGTSGSGKTTFARSLAARLGFSHVELDSLSWGPNWTERPVEEFSALVQEATNVSNWVCDGNYSKVRDLLWRRADTIIWLDYSLWVVMRRVIWRTMRRVFLREVLWSGNREEFWRTFTRDSIIWWAWTTHARRKREYPERLARPENAHLTVFRFASPREAERWLSVQGSPVLG
jgi:adenylate kinase family enzyme